jgi:hypothetical protein
LVAAAARGIFSSDGKDAAAAFRQPRTDAMTISRYSPRLELVQAGHFYWFTV